MIPVPAPGVVLTYAGGIADYGGRGSAGARLLGRTLADRLHLEQISLDGPPPETIRSWRSELTGAMASLLELQAAHAEALARPGSVTVLPRCATALATLPNLAQARSHTRLVWLDAHADLNTPASTPTGYIGGMVLSAAIGWWDSGLGAGVPADHVVLVGTRDCDPFERSAVDDGVISCATGPQWLADLDSFVGDAPVYVHLDVDVLEPGIVPAEYAVPGGLLLTDLRDAAERLAQNPLVGVEIAEFEAPARSREIDGSGTGLLDALAPLLTSAGQVCQGDGPF